MANNEIWIVIKVMDQATAWIKKVSWQLSSFAERNEDIFKSMSIWWTAAFAAITAWAYKAVSAFAESERAERQLDHAVRSVSKWTLEQVEAIKKQTQALQDKAWIDADSLNMWVAQLSTFWLQTKSVQDLTKSLADLTINQNWVNATADQYVSSANIMAKAMRWEFGMLEKMGIRFTEHQQQIINTGTETERVAAIQEWFAQNLRETTDSISWADLALAKSTRSMEDMVEVIWKSLAPSLEIITNSIQPIIQSISTWIGNNPQLTSTIIMVMWAIALLVATLGTLGLILPSIITWITAMGAAIAFVWWPILILIWLIWVLAVTVYKNRDEIKQWTSDFVEAMSLYRRALKTNIETIAMEIKNSVAEILIRWILSIVTWWMSELFIMWAWWWDNVVSYVYSAIEPMVARVSWKLDAIVWFVNKIKSALDSAKSIVWWAITTATNVITWQRAFGGTMQAWRSYLVWERWPEVVTPPSTSKVSTSVWWGTNISINMGGVTVNNEADENRLVDKITQAINRQTQLYQFWIN